MSQVQLATAAVSASYGHPPRHCQQHSLRCTAFHIQVTFSPLDSQLAQLWLRPRELGDFKGVGDFEAKFRLNGYVSREYLSLDGGMVILQLCRWKFHSKKLCSRLFD